MTVLKSKWNGRNEIISFKCAGAINKIQLFMMFDRFVSWC